MPSGLAAGGLATSGGMTWLPVAGDHVWVRFLDGEAEKPVWEWGMQDQKQPETMPLNTYDKEGSPTVRGALTRYGHILEWIPTQIMMSTSKGYSVTCVDAGNFDLDGYISIRTPKFNTVEIFDDLDLMQIQINESIMIITNIIEAFSSFVTFTTENMWTAKVGIDYTVTAGNDVKLTAANSITEIAGVDYYSESGQRWSALSGTDMSLEAAVDMWQTCIKWSVTAASIATINCTDFVVNAPVCHLPPDVYFVGPSGNFFGGNIVANYNSEVHNIAGMLEVNAGGNFQVNSGGSQVLQAGGRTLTINSGGFFFT